MKHKHNAQCGDQFCFHGAFRKKADAVEKERKTDHAFVRGLHYGPGDYRYAVLTPRTDDATSFKFGANPPAHLRLDRTGLRRWNMAVEWMQENSWNYFAAQPLAQDAGTKYNVPVKELLPYAQQIKKQSQGNGLFTRRQKRKIRQRARHGIRQAILGPFGLARKPVRFASGRSAQPRAAMPHKLRDDVISGLVNLGYKPAMAKKAVAATSGEDLTSWLRNALNAVKKNPSARCLQVRCQRCGADVGEPCMISPAAVGKKFHQIRVEDSKKVKSNPTESLESVRSRLSPKDREYFDATSDFFREWHGSDPKKVIRRQATIIEAGDYMLLGRFYGYDIEGWEQHPFREMKPNVQVKENSEIMLCGASLEEVKKGEYVAHQALIIGGDQNLDPVLEKLFEVTSTADLLILGRLVKIWYVAKKKVVNYQLTHWHHTFGEEEKSPQAKRDARPYLMYDRIHKKQFIVGGEYSIPVEGIRN